MDELQKHWFGLPVPKGVKPVRAWGARAILRNERVVKPVKRTGRTVGHDYVTKVTFELLWDRQSYRGPDDRGKEAFTKWLNKEGINDLARCVDEACLGLDEDRQVQTGRTGGGLPAYHLLANPRKSYGHLYMLAWEEPDGETTEDPQEG